MPTISNTSYVYIITSITPSAINKSIMRDVYFNKGSNKFILVSTGNKKESLFYWNIFYKKAQNTKIIFAPHFFSFLRNNVSIRLFKFSHFWDISIAILFCWIRSGFSGLSIINHDTTRLVDYPIWLKKALRIRFEHVFHSNTIVIKNHKVSNENTYVFVSLVQYDYFINKFSELTEGNSIYRPVDVFKAADYLSILNLQDKKLASSSVQSILPEIIAHINRFDYNLIYFGRMISTKGVKELVSAIRELKNEKVGLVLIGQSCDWFESWYIDEKENVNVRYFGGPFVDIERILIYFDLSCVLSDDETGPLAVLEAAEFNVKTIVRDKPYACQDRIAPNVIIVEDKDYSNNLSATILKILKSNKKYSDSRFD
jgi:glycosyltransferase involved in cell wall biosynthesis